MRDCWCVPKTKVEGGETLKEKEYDIMLVNKEKELEKSTCKEIELNDILKGFLNTNARLLCIMNYEEKEVEIGRRNRKSKR